MRFIKTVLVVVLLFVVGVVVWIGSGVYAIGADEPHWPVTERVIDILRNRSIETHARGIAVPNLDDPKRLTEGAEHYAAMCTGCHLAPGMQNSELREGLYPAPPNLAQLGIQDPAQAFWTIKHGVKLSAMPAWGKSHSDVAIWDLVAFVRQLPHMSPEQYRQATGGSTAAAEHHHHHDESTAPDTSDHPADADHAHASDHAHDDHGG